MHYKCLLPLYSKSRCFYLSCNINFYYSRVEARAEFLVSLRKSDSMGKMTLLQELARIFKIPRTEKPCLHKSFIKLICEATHEDLYLGTWSERSTWVGRWKVGSHALLIRCWIHTKIHLLFNEHTGIVLNPPCSIEGLMILLTRNGLK